MRSLLRIEDGWTDLRMNNRQTERKTKKKKSEGQTDRPLTRDRQTYKTRQTNVRTVGPSPPPLVSGKVMIYRGVVGVTRGQRSSVTTTSSTRRRLIVEVVVGRPSIGFSRRLVVVSAGRRVRRGNFSPIDLGRVEVCPVTRAQVEEGKEGEGK